jgi:hypothetical protein
MSDAHPWLSWLYVLVIFAIGLTLVMLIVRQMIRWANKKDDQQK